MRKLSYPLAFAVLLVLASATLSQAGGWAVITLDDLPMHVVAGQPVSIGFTVRQHGRTLLGGLNPHVKAFRSDPYDVVITAATAGTGSGHYQATLTFPSAATWRWSIDAFGMDQPMPPLTVLAAAPAPGVEPSAATSNVSVPTSATSVGMPWSFPLLIGIAGLAVTAGSLVFWRRAGARPLLGIAVIAAVVGATGFGMAAFQPASQPMPAAAAQPPASKPQSTGLDSTQIGKDLFIAKGCIVCHSNAAVSDAIGSFRSLDVGPNLSNLAAQRADPDQYRQWLHKWLWNPSLIKPGTEMPTLGLKEAEIDALAVFLTAKAP